MSFKHHRYYLILAISVYLFLVSCATGNYSIYHAAILNYYPKAGYGHIVDPVQEIDPINDKDVIVYISLENRRQTYNIKYKLYRPDGSLFRTLNDVMRQEGPYQIIYNIAWIKSISLSIYPGEWKAEIYVDGMLAKTKRFNVIERVDLVNIYKDFLNKAKYYKVGINVAKAIYSPTLSSLNINWEENYGIVIEKIQENSPAEKGGLKVGDIILEINGDKIYSIDEFGDSIAYSKTPDKTIVYIYRPTTKEYLTKKLKLELMDEADLLTSIVPASDFQKYMKQRHINFMERDAE